MYHFKKLYFTNERGDLIMRKRIISKKAIAMLSILVVLLSCMSGNMKANAAESASWSVTYNPNYSTTRTVSIQQLKTARASCTSISHTNAYATIGYSYISCLNYSMTKKTITNTGSVTCNPNNGDPLMNITVNYRVSSYSPASNDTFISSGSISKIY